MSKVINLKKRKRLEALSINPPSADIKKVISDRYGIPVDELSLDNFLVYGLETQALHIEEVTRTVMQVLKMMDSLQKRVDQLEGERNGK